MYTNYLKTQHQPHKMRTFLLGVLLIFVTLTFFAFTPPATPEQKVEVTTKYGKFVVKLYNQTPLHRDNFIKLVKEGFYDSLLFHRVIPDFIIQGGDPTSKHAQAGTILGQGYNGYRIPAEINPRLYHKRGALAAARDDNPGKASSGCQFYIVEGRTFTRDEISNLLNTTNYNLKSQLFASIMVSDSIKARLDDFTLRGDKQGMHAYMLGMQTVVDSLFAPMEITFSNQQILDYMNIGGAPHLDMNYTVFGEVVSGMNIIDSIMLVKRDANDRPVEDLRIKMRLVK